MSDSIELIVAFLLYLMLFGWIGFRRGVIREAIVLVVALGGYLALWRYASAVRTLINLFWKFFYFARGGGLTGGGDAFDLLREAPDLIAPEQTGTVVFIIWAVLLVLTYAITAKFVPSAASRSNLTAALLGMVNGLVYLGIFLPLMASLVAPEVRAQWPTSPEESIIQILSRAWALFADSLALVWESYSAQRPYIFLLLIILVLVVAVRSLRPAT